MSRPSKSQWDFGELFPPEATRKVLSVSELTMQVKRLLEKQVGQVWVSGEITNFRAQSSGHFYFTLKDVGAQLSCVLFRAEKVANRELLADGQKVLLQGDVTVYEARGQYQMLVRAVELQGVGALQAAFERLKLKLAAEGLFAQERKRSLPRFPQRIGLVTSATGAAIRDVLHVVQRRHPSLEIILAACRVQGTGAATEVAGAIRMLNQWSISPGGTPLDLILVTRGGGSLEDLWAFNEEAVARAVFESALPVVSAVGHEIDFSICDFVADLRAATPSVAAEIITEGVFASREFVADVRRLMALRMTQRLERDRENFEAVEARLQRVHPRRKVDEALQRLDDLSASLQRGAKLAVRERTVAWQNLAGRLARVRPSHLVKQRQELFQLQARRLQEHAATRLRAARNRFEQLQARLKLLGPEQVLARGYSITTDEATGALVRDAATVKKGQRLRTRLKAGEVRSVVD